MFWWIVISVHALQLPEIPLKKQILATNAAATAMATLAVTAYEL